MLFSIGGSGTTGELTIDPSFHVTQCTHLAGYLFVNVDIWY